LPTDIRNYVNLSIHINILRDIEDYTKMSSSPSEGSLKKKEEVKREVRTDEAGNITAEKVEIRKKDGEGDEIVEKFEHTIQDKGKDKDLGIEDKLGAAAQAVGAKIKQPTSDFQTEYEKGLDKEREGVGVVRDVEDAGEKMKAGAKAVGEKIKDPDKDLGTEYEKKMDRESEVGATEEREDTDFEIRKEKSEAGKDVEDAGEKIKAGAKALGKKVEDPDKDMNTEYEKEKLEEKTKLD
jgi:hypothetical protein